MAVDKKKKNGNKKAGKHVSNTKPEDKHRHTGAAGVTRLIFKYTTMINKGTHRCAQKKGGNETKTGSGKSQQVT